MHIAARVALVTSIVVAWSGCPGPGASEGEGDGGGDEGEASEGEGDGAEGDGGEGDEGEISADITSPTGTVYTNGTVTIVVQADVPPTLYDGDAPLALTAVEDELTFTFAWDTTTASEGEHAVTAHAGFDVSAPVTIVVDRTPPAIAATFPAAGDANADQYGPFLVTFDEPIDGAGATATLVDDAGNGAVTTVSQAEGDEMVVYGDGALPVPASAHLTIGGVADRAGNAMVEATMDYGVPVLVDLGDPAAGAAVLAADIAAYDAEPIAFTAEGDASAVSLFVRSRAPFTGEWVAWGGDVAVDGPPAEARDLRLAVASDGTMTAAFRQRAAESLGFALHVRRFDGTTWVSLGDALSTFAASADLALAADGTPWIAFADDALAHVDVVGWDGAAWSLGALDLETSGAALVALDVDALARPVLAFTGTLGATVLRLADGSWTQLGDPLAVRGDGIPFGIAALDVAVDPSDDSPWVAFVQTGNARQPYDGVHVMRFDGAAWRTMGHDLELDANRDASVAVEIAFTDDATPVVAWRERDAAQVAQPTIGHLARFVDGTWQLVGPGVGPLDGDMRIAPSEDGVLVLAHTSDVEGTTVLRENASAIPFGLDAIVANTACAIPDAPLDGSSIAELGCYADVASRTPIDAAIPYDLNAPLWSDGALKRRFVLLPPGGTIGFSEFGSWTFPVGTIVMKEFLLDDDTPMETRFLVRRPDLAVPNDNWLGFSYQWNADGTDAVLLADAATTATFSNDNGSHVHTFPSRSDCNRCHVRNNGPGVLGLNTGNMNRATTYASTVDDQLRALDHAGAFGDTYDHAAPALHTRMASYADTGESDEARARAYLHSNCVHCHRAGGEQGTRRWGPYQAAQSDTDLCSTNCAAGAQCVTPGEPTTSRVWLRDQARTGDGSGLTSMPPLATLIPDPDDDALLRAWITTMTCP